MDSIGFDKVQQLTDWSRLTYQEMRVFSQDIEKCSICQYELDDNDRNIVMLGRCKGYHFFHDECIERCRQGKNFLKCPNCLTVYGRYFGNMPEGTMNISKNLDDSLPGHQRYGIIIIEYSFRNQQVNNIALRGITRIAYLPDSPLGNHVLSLLVKAFHARVTFTVGRSVTMDRENAITWNGIHHKTNIIGGSSNYGYPDPTYLSRVLEELKSFGIH